MTTSEAIKHFGSIKDLAQALNIWPHNVYRWGVYPPKGKQFEIQIKSDNKLKVEEKYLA